MDSKLLIILQFWEGDLAQATRLVEFLSQVESGKNNWADFLLVRRRDCPEMKKEAIEALSRRFNVWTYRSPKSETGWPQGCNGLWFASMEWFYGMISEKKCPEYKAAFTCEADGAPIVKNWVERLSKEWDRVNNPRPVCIAGPLTQIPGEHINGNCMVSGNLGILKWITRELNGGITGGWDYCLAQDFKRRGWANIPGIRSYYGSSYYTQEQYAQMVIDDLTWVHGDKSGCLIDWGKNPLIGLTAPADLRKGYAEELVKAYLE